MVIYVIATLLRPMRGREAGLAPETTPLVQARSQKFAMGGLFAGVWGRSPQPPEANGGWGFGGKTPSRRRHGGVGAKPPALENFAFFLRK